MSSEDEMEIDFEEKPHTLKRSSSQLSDASSQSSESAGPSNLSPVSTPRKSSFGSQFWQNSSKRQKIDFQDMGTGNMILIKDLDLGMGKTHALQVKVSFLSEIKTTKSGAVFVFHGFDSTGDISFVTYGKKAQELSSVIMSNNMYEIGPFTVKPVKERFPTGTSCPLEVTINHDSDVKPIEMLDKISNFEFEFEPLNVAKKSVQGSRKDVIGILIGDQGTNSTGGKLYRRLAITDISKTIISVTLWGEQASTFKSVPFSCIAVRRPFYSQFNGEISISVGFDSLIWVEPDIQFALSLKDWFLEQKDSGEFTMDFLTE